MTWAALLDRTASSYPGNGKRIMLKKPQCPVIAIEEHYWDEELAKTYSGVEGTRRDDQLKRLYDLGDLRIKDMDEAGGHIPILSPRAPPARQHPRHRGGPPG